MLLNHAEQWDVHRGRRKPPRSSRAKKKKQPTISELTSFRVALEIALNMEIPMLPGQTQLSVAWSRTWCCCVLDCQLTGECWPCTGPSFCVAQRNAAELSMIIILTKTHTKEASSNDVTALQVIVSLALVQQKQQQEKGEEAAGFRR